jgi:hypothetical protein
LVTHAARIPHATDARGILDLMTLRGWKLVRAPGLDGLDAVVDELLRALD